jgi:predicted RNase H-like HicB family nuclease
MDNPQTPDEYLRLPYTRALVPDADSGTFAAHIVEFPGCVAQGDTPAEAYAELESVAREWIAAAKEQDHAIPEPFITVGYSGKFALRLPRSLHKQAAQFADMERTSLNQFIVSALAEKIGALRMYYTLANRFGAKVALTAVTGALRVVTEAPSRFAASIRRERIGPMPMDSAASTARVH